MPTPLAHHVYFTLADPTPENRAALVAACHEHLSGHEGVTNFAVGTVAEGLERPVNDRAFDVALGVEFASREAHDAYQVDPRHKLFIEQMSANWASVRIFDADLTPAG